MKKIKLLICKISGYILKLFGRGSNFPGELLLKLDKNYSKYFKMPKLVIAVTGSAGKGSTTTMIADALRSDGLLVAYNKFGSNMLPGILSLLINNSDLSGNIKADALVLEVDERYTKKVFDMTKPGYVVITNILRDQPPRHGNYDMVFDKIKKH
jgi:UDP-N-acetylmuramyl pentapeptide synthase